MVDADDEAEVPLGEIVEFTADNKIRLIDSDGDITEEVKEYECNDSQIHVPEDDMLFKYRVRGDKLSLREMETGIKLQLVRVPKG